MRVDETKHGRLAAVFLSASENALKAPAPALAVAARKAIAVAAVARVIARGPVAAEQGAAVLQLAAVEVASPVCALR
jgi:hypothetical protein